MSILPLSIALLSMLNQDYQARRSLSLPSLHTPSIAAIFYSHRIRSRVIWPLVV
jgi:hypothetical protein